MSSKKIGLVGDSGMLIPGGFLEQLEADGIPYAEANFIILFGEEEVVDKIEISPEEFYKRQAKYYADTGKLPTTSQAPVKDYAEAYRNLAEQGAETIFVFPITKELSGSYEAAKLAHKELTPDLDVRVIDTLNGSPGQFIQMEAAYEAYMGGASIEKIKSEVEKAREETYLMLFVDNPLYLSKRVGGLKGWGLNTFGVKPVLELVEGNLEPRIKLRTIRQSMNNMFSLLEQRLEEDGINPETAIPQAYAIYTDQREIGVELAKMIEDLYGVCPDCDIPVQIGTVCPAIGNYLGPGAGGIVIRHI